MGGSDWWFGWGGLAEQASWREGGGELPGRRGSFRARADEKAAAAECFDSGQRSAPLAAPGK